MRSKRNTDLIAARIPEKPAPITLTFIGRWFSTGASFSKNGVVPFVLPLV